MLLASPLTTLLGLSHSYSRRGMGNTLKRHPFSGLVHSAEILKRLSDGFGLFNSEWQSDDPLDDLDKIPPDFQPFFRYLQKIMPKVRVKLHTPNKVHLRSNKTLQPVSTSSATDPASSPQFPKDVGRSSNPLAVARFPTDDGLHIDTLTSKTLKSADPADSSPSAETPQSGNSFETPMSPRSEVHYVPAANASDAADYANTSTTFMTLPKRQRSSTPPSQDNQTGTASILHKKEDFWSRMQSSIQNNSPIDTPASKRSRFWSLTNTSPSLPARPLVTRTIDVTTTTFFQDIGSSQTDSTYQESDSVEQLSEEGISDGDRPESMVTQLVHSMLDVIGKQHSKCNGYKFEVDEPQRLCIPIEGQMCYTTPDKTVSMLYHDGRRTKRYYVVDLECKRLKMNVNEQEKFAQEVAHLLGRRNEMKSWNAADHYNVFLISVHNTKVYISNYKLQNKYLVKLNTKLPSEDQKPKEIVHRYGPACYEGNSQSVHMSFDHVKKQGDSHTNLYGIDS